MRSNKMLWDYIVIGGGLSGSVVSSHLWEGDNSLKILVVEAGPNANDDPSLVWTNSTNGIGGEYDWNLTSIAQANLNGRRYLSLWERVWVVALS